MKHASEMTEVEFRAARAARAWKQPAVVGKDGLRSQPPPAPQGVQAQRAAIDADLKAAFTNLYAVDANDALTLLDRRRIKTNSDGRITNAAELAADLQKTKPHFFATHAANLTDEEFANAMRNRAWRSR